MDLTNDIFNQETRQAMKKLAKFGGKLKDMKTFMMIVKLSHEYDKTASEFDFAHNALVFEYCDKNSDGSPILLPNGNQRIGKNTKEFLNKQKELISQKVKLGIDEVVVISLDDNKELLSINGGPLTPSDVSALLDLVNFEMSGG